MNSGHESAEGTEVLLLDMVERQRYEVVLAEDGTLVSLVTYRRSTDWIALLHTEVQPGFEGQGMGSRTAKLAFDDARRRNLKVVPKCPFILRWLERHPEQHDVLLRPLAVAQPKSGAPDPLNLG